MKGEKIQKKLPTRFERVTLGSAIPRSTADLRELFSYILISIYIANQQDRAQQRRKLPQIHDYGTTRNTSATLAK